MVGGGVAGVCCAEEVCRIQPDAFVTLITPDQALKVRLLAVDACDCALTRTLFSCLHCSPLQGVHMGSTVPSVYQQLCLSGS